MTGSTTAGRFLLLDGLRGIAALMVLVLHATQGMPWYVANSNHAQLSVDFFFALSGFVLFHAYADRLSHGMSFMSFMQRRWIRLTPMVAVGMAIATFAYAVKLYQQGKSDQIGQLLGGSLLNAMYLPSPWLLELDQGNAYLANSPIWSLTSEMVASAAFAMVLFRLSNWALAGIAAVFAFALLGYAQTFGAIDHGWEFRFLPIGLVRVAFSFTAGVLVQRVVAIRKTESVIPAHQLKILGLVGLLLLASYLPVPKEINGLYEFLCVFALFPALIYLASSMLVTGFMARLALFLGDLSFPLYALHYGVLRYFQPLRVSAWFQDHHVLVMWIEVIVSCCVAWVAFRWIDQPARAWLNQRIASSELAKVGRERAPIFADAIVGDGLKTQSVNPHSLP